MSTAKYKRDRRVVASVVSQSERSETCDTREPLEQVNARAHTGKFRRKIALVKSFVCAYRSIGLTSVRYVNRTRLVIDSNSGSTLIGE